jgi:hypothetical protein
VRVDFERRKGYLYAALRGDFDLAGAMNAYREVLQAAAREHALRVLLDCTALGGNPTMDERREFGAFMAEEQAKYGALGALQVAILASPQAMDPGRYLQTVANNRGVRLRTSDSLTELLSWLGV